MWAGPVRDQTSKPGANTDHRTHSRGRGMRLPEMQGWREVSFPTIFLWLLWPVLSMEKAPCTLGSPPTSTATSPLMKDLHLEAVPSPSLVPLSSLKLSSSGRVNLMQRRVIQKWQCSVRFGGTGHVGTRSPYSDSSPPWLPGFQPGTGWMSLSPYCDSLLIIWVQCI